MNDMLPGSQHIMRNASILLAILFAQGMAFAEDGLDDPSFALPVISGRDCAPDIMGVGRVRANTVLSIARKTQGKEFIEVESRIRAKDSASCVIEVRFEKPLAEPGSLAVDFCGIEAKTPRAIARLSVKLDSQEYVFDYARGRMLDASSGKVTKRFQLIDLPAGSTHVSIAISGEAASFARGDSAMIGFDSLDMCFVSGEEQPEFCGAPGYPNPRAAL
jgi:hypothetical protein